MKLISSLSIQGVATTYIAYLRQDRRNIIEFVESTPPPYRDRMKKWVIILSSQIGCRMGCRFCDAANYYYGNLHTEEIIEQVDYILTKNDHYSPDKTQKFKIQFARMGEPSLNMNVLDAMLVIRTRFKNYIPCIATIAPSGSEEFFKRLLMIRDEFVDLQLQFSINSTDDKFRDFIMPAKKMSLEWISGYIDRFYKRDKRKPVLNFAIDSSDSVNPEVIKRIFDPRKCIVKLTPINPTQSARRNIFDICENSEIINSRLKRVASKLSDYGFESIISIGDLRENIVFSNCGQIASFTGRQL